MKNEPLIDPEQYTGASVLHTADVIRRYCKQRGRFQMLDGILRCDDELAVGFKDLLANDWWADDHIPGRPIFPGVLQCEGAAQLASFDYLRRRPEMMDVFLGFAGLDGVRFRGLVVPPARVLYAVTPIRVRSKLFVYRSEGFVSRERVFEGEILGVVM